MTTFDTPAELDRFIRLLINEGEQTSLPFIDRLGQIWLTYGEEDDDRESVDTWLIGGATPTQPLPLDRAAFPMLMLVAPESARSWKCPRCLDWFTDTDEDRPPVCDFCVKGVGRQ